MQYCCFEAFVFLFNFQSSNCTRQETCPFLSNNYSVSIGEKIKQCRYKIDIRFDRAVLSNNLLPDSVIARSASQSYCRVGREVKFHSIPTALSSVTLRTPAKS